MGGPSPRPWIVEEVNNECCVIGNVTIVGWTLSCDNAGGQSVSFKHAGGIGKNRLEVTAWAPRDCEWHCRVTYKGTPK